VADHVLLYPIARAVSSRLLENEREISREEKK
jgi:hypothetical protein